MCSVVRRWLLPVGACLPLVAGLGALGCDPSLEPESEPDRSESTATAGASSAAQWRDAQRQWRERDPRAHARWRALDPSSSEGQRARRRLHRQLYERLFRDSGGDFEAMARRLMQGDPRANARRVRLRFNQLGLRARSMRASGARGNGDGTT